MRAWTHSLAGVRAGGAGVGGLTIIHRRLVAVFLVLALTGSALAVTQQRLYEGEKGQAESVVAVQQHSVFVEIIIEEEDRDGEEDEIHEFAAVVGLIKKCKRIREERAFDNAVLWFNDQFLFGDKETKVNHTNETPDSALGVNPEDNNLMKVNGETGRWGGCYTPDGFALAMGSDDPYGVGAYPTNATVDGIELIRELITLDNLCSGCIFEYQSSFFVTDPNRANWIVDKFVYPVSVLGNLFQEGEDNPLNDGDCASDNGVVPFSDPRDTYPHHDRCQADEPENNHDCQAEQRDCAPPERQLLSNGGNETDNSTIVEPLFAVHLQVDPLSAPGMGFIDRASWEYRDGSGPVQGMPISQDPTDPAFETCKTDVTQAFECAIEYNFLVAVDFGAFDDDTTLPGENEIDEEGAEHSQGAFPQPRAYEGNSHPHNPQTFDPGPDHEHSTVSLDIFFHEQAPSFTMKHAYWDENGSPPRVNDDCSDTANSNAPADEKEAVQVRSPIVCDNDQDSRFHAHDGSQTIRPK